jgi:hypothetical protein
VLLCIAQICRFSARCSDRMVADKRSGELI